MTKPVPIEAAAQIAGEIEAHRSGAGHSSLCQFDLDLVEQLADFALQFRPRALLGMVVNVMHRRPVDLEPGDEPSQDVASLDVPAMAGEVNEILITDETIDAHSFDLIRLNMRVFVPEVIEVVEEPASLHVAGNGQELTLDDVDRVVEGLEALRRFMADPSIADA